MRQAAAPQRVLVKTYVCVKLGGDFTNSADTVAGRTAVRLNADNLNNLSGRLTGHDVGVTDRPPD